MIRLYTKLYRIYLRIDSEDIILAFTCEESDKWLFNKMISSILRHAPLGFSGIKRTCEHGQKIIGNKGTKGK